MTPLAFAYLAIAAVLVALYVWFIHLKGLTELYRWIRASGRGRVLALAAVAIAFIGAVGLALIFELLLPGKSN